MNNLDKLIRKKLEKQIEDSHTIVCKRIDADLTLTPIKKRYLKKTSYRLCKHEILVEHNRLLDLHMMIKADQESRALRDMPLPPKDICKCVEGNRYCFCVNSKNQWLVK
jgi:hypothetical protein